MISKKPTRRPLSSTEMFQYAERAQAAVLVGLASVRRWSSQELVFQGGTSLHMAYGSPRLSEDLDFIIRRDLVESLGPIMEKAADFAKLHMGSASDWVWTLKDREADRVPEEMRNPRVFMLSMQAPDWGQAVKVKLEFWAVESEAFDGYEVESKLLHTHVELGDDFEEGILNVAALESIAVDKIWAIAGRERTKARDWFDLWWMSATQGLSSSMVAKAVITQAKAHELMYPRDPRRTELPGILEARSAQVGSEIDEVASDLKRWLLLSPELAEKTPLMVSNAIQFVEEILKNIRKHLDEK